MRLKVAYDTIKEYFWTLAIVYFNGRCGQTYFGLGLGLVLLVRVRLRVRLSFRVSVRNRTPVFAIAPAKLHGGHMKISRRNAIAGTNPYC